MSKDKGGIGGDYEVGYCKPPLEHRFKKGKSGHLAGRPKKRKRKPIDVAAVLNEPLTVKTSGVLRKMQPFEVMFRRLVERGLKHGDLKAILEFLAICESHGLMMPPPNDWGNSVVHAPKGVDYQEWLDKNIKLVTPSSLDEDDTA